MGSLTIVKIGGKILDDKEMLDECLHAFSRIPGPRILVHGGGRSASNALISMGIKPVMHKGRRVTDLQTLEVVVGQYAGVINKGIVAKLQALDVDALGLTGADGNIIRAYKRKVKTYDYGFAGDIDKVDSHKLLTLISLGFTPIICPITHDKKGQLLNTNADTVATEVAIALSSDCEVSLRYCFEYKGVLKDLESKEVIPVIRKDEIENMIATGVLSDGMIPKIRNAGHAQNSGVNEAVICGIKNMINLENATRLR